MNWRNLSVGHEKYVRFSSTCDFSGFLGNKGMGRKVILDDAEQDHPTQHLRAPTDSVVEVEEAIAVDGNGAGTNSQRPHVKDETEDVEMMDTDVDMEAKSSPKHERTASPSPTPRKRRRSSNAKPSSNEGANPTLKKPVLTSRRTRSQVDVVVPPRNSRNPAKLEQSTSHKLLVSESPVSVRTASSVKAKTPGKKSVLALDTDEEREPVSTKRAPPKQTQKRKRRESESEEEPELSEEPTPGPSKPKLTQKPARESSPAPSHDAPARGRRSAAQKADEKLKGIMPDVINFQKQMKRGVVVGEWEKAEKEQERVEKKEREKLKENTRENVKETTKRRRSDMRYDALERAYSNLPRADDFKHSAKGEEEDDDDDDDEPATSKSTGTNVRIMTTKVNVSEDTKKVQSTLKSQWSNSTSDGR